MKTTWPFLLYNFFVSHIFIYSDGWVTPRPQRSWFRLFQYKSTVVFNHTFSVFQRRVTLCRRRQTPCRSSQWSPTATSLLQTLQQKHPTPLPSQLLTTEQHQNLQTTDRADRQWDWKPDMDWIQPEKKKPIFITDTRPSQRQGDTKALDGRFLLPRSCFRLFFFLYVNFFRWYCRMWMWKK